MQLQTFINRLNNLEGVDLLKAPFYSGEIFEFYELSEEALQENETFFEGWDEIGSSDMAHHFKVCVDTLINMTNYKFKTDLGIETKFDPTLKIVKK